MATATPPTTMKSTLRRARFANTSSYGVTIVRRAVQSQVRRKPVESIKSGPNGLVFFAPTTFLKCSVVAFSGMLLHFRKLLHIDPLQPLLKLLRFLVLRFDG